jgi:hypothetical protein
MPAGGVGAMTGSRLGKCSDLVNYDLARYSTNGWRGNRVAGIPLIVWIDTAVVILLSCFGPERRGLFGVRAFIA